MQGTRFIVSVFCAVLIGVLGSGAASSFAQDELGRGIVIVGGEGGGVEKNCCTYMGVNLEDLTARTRSKADYPHKTGVFISSVEPGSPADKAGLREGDIVYLFNGTKVEDPAQLASLVRKREPEERVKLVIYRSGKEKNIDVMLAHREVQKILSRDFGKYSDELSRALSDVGRSAAQVYKRMYFMQGRLGMSVVDLNEDIASYFNVKVGEGALVLDVEADSPADEAGIRGGDILTSVDGLGITDADGVVDALSDIEAGDTVSIDLVRKGARKTVEIGIEGNAGLREFYIAPFERSKIEKESIESRFPEKSRADAAKLKEEMKALKERLKEMEDRLSEVEKNK